MPTPIGDQGAAGTAGTVAVNTSGDLQTPPAKKQPAPKRGTKKPAAPTQYTAKTWAQALLTRLGAPVTAANVQALVSWEAAEGGHWNNTAHFNPLNTTLDQPGSYSMNDLGNGHGVQAYKSWEDGLNATVSMLNQQNMGAIKTALMHGNSAIGVAQAVTQHSPWGTHSIQIGNYPTYGTGSVDTSTGTVAGTGTTNTGPTAPTKPQTVQQYLDNTDLQAQYGYLTSYMHDPELGPILAKAAQNGWGQNQLLGAISKTHWWKTTSDTARAWQEQQRMDPAAAKQRLDQTVSMIQEQAQSTLGAALSSQRAAQIAQSYIGQGWTATQLQAAIGAEFHYNPKQTPGGQAGATIDSLRQHAAQYLVPISDQTLGQWTQGVLKGTFKDTDFDSYLKQQAASLYPTLTKALDAGVTTRQYLDPYAQLVQQTLGHNPDDINWMDPKWSKALNTTTPDGQRAPMSLSDWGSYLRGLPEYQTTDQARQQGSDLALNIVKTFGKVGG